MLPLGLLLKSVCVGLSISLAPFVCAGVAIGVGVDFDICFVWLILHTAHPTIASIAAYFLSSV